MFQYGGFLGYPLGADRLVEVIRILEVSKCGVSCDWAGHLIMVRAPVYVVPHDVFYARVFSVSGSTLSVQASFLFPDEETSELSLQCLESWHNWPGLKPLNTKCPEPNHPSLCPKTLEEEMFVKNRTFFLVCAHAFCYIL